MGSGRMCQSPQRCWDPWYLANLAFYQAQGVLVWICSRVSVPSRPPCPQRPLLSNNNRHCAGERLKGGRRPTQLALCRDTCINKPASNSHNSMEGTVGTFAISCLPQKQLLPQLDTADLDTLGSFLKCEFLKEKLHPAASSSLPPIHPCTKIQCPPSGCCVHQLKFVTHSLQSRVGENSGIWVSSSIC